MLTTKLRRVGGSTMLAIPPAILDLLDLEANAAVTLTVEGRSLIVERPRLPRYTLAELLAQCDGNTPLAPEERGWLEFGPAGRELA
jgi:antitoxin ChpS